MDRNVQTQNILEYFTSMSAEMDCDIVLGEARKMLYQLWEDGIRDLNESNNEHSHLPDEIRSLSPHPTAAARAPVAMNFIVLF